MVRGRIAASVAVAVCSIFTYGDLLAAPKPDRSVVAVVEASRTMTLRGEWERAAQELWKQIDLARAAKDQKSEARLQTEYARVLIDKNFFHKQDRKAAYGAVEVAKRMALRVDDKVSLGDVEQYTGQLRFSEAFSNGDFETPRKYFERALKLREPIGDFRRLSETYFYLGVTLEQQNRLQEAIPFYRRSLECSEKAGDKVMQSYAHRHLGGADEEAGRLDSALHHIERSLQLRREGGFTVGVPFAMLQLVDFLAKHRSDTDSAKRLSEEAIDAAEAANSTRARAFAQLSLAELELKAKRPQVALSYAECALRSAEEFGEPGDVKQVRAQLDEIRSKM